MPKKIVYLITAINLGWLVVRPEPFLFLADMAASDNLRDSVLLEKVVLQAYAEKITIKKVKKLRDILYL